MVDYRRASDDELREAGFDPTWIAEGSPEDGPYYAVRTFGNVCPCCSGETSAWTVLNVATAMGIGQDWFGDNAECDAEEHASALNHAWREGFGSATP